jgi:hypothetical protein
MRYTPARIYGVAAYELFVIEKLVKTCSLRLISTTFVMALARSASAESKLELGSSEPAAN